MDLLLLFKTLLERKDGALEILLLVDVFLLDVRIDLNVFHLLVPHILVESVVYCTLQLLVVVSMLNDPVNSVFEALNVNFILANGCSAVLD